MPGELGLHRGCDALREHGTHKQCSWSTTVVHIRIACVASQHTSRYPRGDILGRIGIVPTKNEPTELTNLWRVFTGILRVGLDAGCSLPLSHCLCRQGRERSRRAAQRVPAYPGPVFAADVSQRSECFPRVKQAHRGIPYKVQCTTPPMQVQCTKTMQGQNTCTMSHVVVGICDDIVCLVGDIVVNVCIAGKAQRVLSTPDNQATIDKWSSMNNLAQLRW